MADEQIEKEISQEPAQAEKTLTQSQVDHLIGRAKAEAHEKATRQAEADYQRKLEGMNAQKQPEQPRNNDTQEHNVDSVYQKVKERLDSERQENEAREIGNYVVEKYKKDLSLGKEKYPDFHEKIDGISFDSFPNLLHTLSTVDDAHDVLYELGTNPTKLKPIEDLASSSPVIARRELQKISDSIKSNQNALNQESRSATRPPLDRLQSSNKAGSDGKMSVSDYKNKPWARG